MRRGSATLTARACAPRLHARNPHRIRETEMFVPRDVDEHSQIMLGGQIQEPFRRNVIDPDEVGPQVANLSEVLRGLFGRGEWLARRVWSEGSVSHAFNVIFLFADP